MTPILRITDGTDTVDLLDIEGWLLNDWSPAVPESKGGGIFRSSPLTDGRKLAYRKMDNVIETFNLVATGHSQNSVIQSIQKLQRLLEKAVSYFTSGWQTSPVWIEAKGPCEGEIRYATIVDYKLSGFGSPFKQPFFNSEGNIASEAILVVEHMFWQDTVPGEDGECVELHNVTDYFSVTNYNVGTFSPSASDYDGYYGDRLSAVNLNSHFLYIGKIPSAGNCKTGIIFNNVTVPVGAHIISATLTVVEAVTVYDAITIKVTGQSQLGGAINSVTLVTAGKGYSNPKVSISSSSALAQGAEIIATQVGGAITELTIVNGGSGYVNPILTIYDDTTHVPPGHGASATATATALGTDAAPFDGTNLDFLNRAKTDAFNMLAYPDEANISTIDVTDIVKEIVSSQYWASGDNVGLFIEMVFGGPRRLYSWDEETFAAPSLTIEWSTTTVPLGRDTTCAAEVYVTNKKNNAPVNFMYRYDDSEINKYSTNLYEYDYTTIPLKLLPTNPAVGDIFYAGSCPISVSDTNYGPFSSLVFDLSTIMRDVTGVWEYYNGAWVEFDTSGTTSNELCGDQINFEKLGVGSIVFKQPPNWTQVQVTDGVDNKTGFWIRFRVTAVGGSPVRPEQQHRDIYTILLPYIDIDAERVPGDIPALARIIFDAAVCEQRSMNTMVLGLRSLSRGEDFEAYLNASDRQGRKGITFSLESLEHGSHHLQDDSSTPTGRILDLTTFAPVASFSPADPPFLPLCSWSLSDVFANQYIGVYHAYVRCQFPLASEGRMRLRLKAVFGEEYNVSYSDITSVSLGNQICAVDLGQLSILSSFQLRSTESLGNIKIYIESLSTEDTDYNNSFIYDVILIPADEWSGNFGMPKITGMSVLGYGYGLEVDGITTPKQYRAVETYASPTSTKSRPTNIMADWSKIASGEPIFQTNVDQRLWFFQYKHQDGLVSYFEDSGAVRAKRSSRYILARGYE